MHGRTPLAGAPPAWLGLIYFDSSRVFGTASYYMWKTLSANRPSRTLDTEVSFSDEENFKIAGQIGLGTWDAPAEFKDLRVEKAGQVLYAADFEQGATGWITEPSQGGIGRWTVNDGAFRQSEVGRGAALFGDKDWSDYTVTVKARKFSGREGFLITVGRQRDDYYWWNLGGWGNTRHTIEHSWHGSQTPVGEGKPGTIESNPWYDIKIMVYGDSIRCFLDGQLINEKPRQAFARIVCRGGTRRRHRGYRAQSDKCFGPANHQPFEIELISDGTDARPDGTGKNAFKSRWRWLAPPAPVPVGLDAARGIRNRRLSSRISTAGRRTG